MTEMQVNFYAIKDASENIEKGLKLNKCLPEQKLDLFGKVEENLSKVEQCGV